MYICIYTYTCIATYIYIYREREREIGLPQRLTLRCVDGQAMSRETKSLPLILTVSEIIPVVRVVVAMLIT